MRFRFAFLLLFIFLNACVDGPTMKRPGVKPVRGVDAAALKICIGKLDRVVARYALLENRTFGGGCSALGAVQLDRKSVV